MVRRQVADTHNRIGDVLSRKAGDDGAGKVHQPVTRGSTPAMLNSKISQEKKNTRTQSVKNFEPKLIFNILNASRCSYDTLEWYIRNMYVCVHSIEHIL